MNKQTIKETTIEIKTLKNQIEEAEKPLVELKNKISTLEIAIERGHQLKESDYFAYERQGGNEAIKNLCDLLNTRSEELETVKAKVENQAKPLLIALSNKEALLTEMLKKSASKIERERKNREESKTPIDLVRWAKRLRWQRHQALDPLVWKAIGLAYKREKQIIDQIIAMHNLKLVGANVLSKHYANKYKKYRLSLYKRGYYLLKEKQA
jgi:chromosome segregation ATPase